jgi:hypothetical protein
VIAPFLIFRHPEWQRVRFLQVDWRSVNAASYNPGILPQTL